MQWITSTERRELRVLWTVVIAAGIATCSALSDEPRDQPRPSLALSCLDVPFLSVSLSSPKRDMMPATRFVVTDPIGRKAGEHQKGNTIPRSRYAEIVEIPKLPLRSKALAVEICNAQQL